jgi:hypothetical protein
LMEFFARTSLGRARAGGGRVSTPHRGRNKLVVMRRCTLFPAT